MSAPPATSGHTGRIGGSDHSGRDRALLLAAFVWLAATAWLRPLAVPDEGRYIGVAWGMLHTGDWLVPMLDGLPYFHKPPLFYWLTAAALAVWDSTAAARIAPWLGACLGSGALFLFARHWAGRDTALMALLALVTAPLFYFGAQYANLDMLVAGCITATILAFAHATLLGRADPAWKRTMVLAYVLCALGVLAKGLIGVVLPGMVIFFWLVLERRWKAIVEALWWPGILCFLAVAAPWFVLMQQRFDSFLHYFFVVQHFQRFASEGGFNNPRPIWFYPVVLAVATLPWSLWWAGSAKLGWRERGPASSARWLMLVWAAAITLFFSMPRSKLAGYILPVVPPLMYLAADAAATLRARSQRWAAAWRIGSVVAIAVCVVAAGLLARHLPDSQGQLARVLRDRAAPGDDVYALDEYRYGLLFEARLRKPVIVVADWSPKAVASRDNWRRELADAAEFATHREWLIEPDAALGRVCAGGAAWLVGNTNIVSYFRWLQRLDKVATAGELTLWNLPAASPVRQDLCRGKPSASSGAR